MVLVHVHISPQASGPKLMSGVFFDHSLYREAESLAKAVTCQF